MEGTPRWASSGDDTAHVYRPRLRAAGVLVDAVDRTGKANADAVAALFREVEDRYARLGLRVRWPVHLEVVRMPIMGATQSQRRSHILYVSLRAARSNMADALIAHEMGHMLRTEERHPSHDPAVHRRMGRAVRIPKEGQPALAGAFNHVQDIYADDYAVRAGLEDRIHDFFGSWIEGTVGRGVSTDPWENLAATVSNGFALGNMRRHGKVDAGDPLWTKARAFDRAAGWEAVDGFASFYESLPGNPEADLIVRRVVDLAATMAHLASTRTTGRAPAVSSR